jgi:sec-independent protein translocase protein TatC
MATDSPTDALDRGYDDADARDDGARMTFLEHLDELRKRILYSIYAVAACAVGAFWYVNPMFDYMKGYFRQHGGELIFTQPTEGFMLQLKVGFLAALILAAPFVFSQLWLFVAPGLYAKEKRVVIPFVFFSSVLFGAGVAFGHLQAFPVMWQFFASFSDEALTFMPTIGYAFSFYVKILLGLGLIFQMPMLVFFLARFGVVTAGFLVRKFKYAVLVMFVIAAIITPSPDIPTQLMFVAPMLVLYAVSIGVAWVFQKRRPKAEDAAA